VKTEKAKTEKAKTEKAKTEKAKTEKAKCEVTNKDRTPTNIIIIIYPGKELIIYLVFLM